MFPSERKRLVFGCLLGFILSAFFIASFSDSIKVPVRQLKVLNPITKDKKNDENFLAWTGMGEEYRRCLADKITNGPNNLNDILSNSVSACLKHIRVHGNISGSESPEAFFKMVSFYNAEGDRKIVLLSDSPECVTVTLELPRLKREYKLYCIPGIGHDIGCEKRMQSSKPHCLFFGADPVYDAGIVYEQVGKYFHIGVGAKDGLLMGQIKSGLGSTDYKLSKNITGVSLDKFLKNYVKKAFIDYLWIDNEGPEFRLIELLKRGGPVVKDFDICQINMEWHYNGNGQMNADLHSESIAQFKAKYADFIKNTPYLPLLANSRTFYFNFDSVTCFNKFFKQYYL